MPNTILLKDHLAYNVIDEWNGKTRKYAYDEVPISRIVPYLGNPVEVGRNFTLRDLWTLIAEDYETLEQIFRAPLGGFPLKPWVEEAQKPSKSLQIDTTKEGMHSLEFQRVREVSIHKKGDRNYSDYVSLHGLGLNTHSWTKTPKKLVKESFSLSFSGLDTILDMTFSLNKKNVLRIMDYPQLKKLKNNKVLTGKQRTDAYLTEIDLGDEQYTLYDVLYALFHEISWFGPPEQRDEASEKLQESVKELDIAKLDGVDKKGRNKKTGKKMFYTSTEVFSDLRKKQKERDDKNKLLAPKMLTHYEKLLKRHKDAEALPVKRYYMTHRENSTFISGADKIKKEFNA